MASAIPTYRKQNAPMMELPTATARSVESPNSPVADALGGLARGGMQLAGVMQQKANEDTENKAAVDVSNVLSQGDVYWQESITEKTKSWKVGDPDLRETVGKEFDTWQQENAAKLPTEAARQYFTKQTNQMKARLQTGVFTFQEKATTGKLNADSAAGEQADENVVFNDPARFNEVFKRRMEPMLARSDLSEAEKIKSADLYKRRLSLAVERGEMERDPKGWYEKRFGTYHRGGGSAAVAAGGEPGGAAGFESVMPKIFKHEGGYAASDGNTGAPVNFGINQKANPDIDVKNLTKEGAAKIYKERYWDKIGGDNLPAALQGTAMDAAVNQGPERAKEWIVESGGDPAKFNALRRAHYEMLLQDPVNKRFRGAWLGRLASYENDSGKPAPGGASTGSAPGAAPVKQGPVETAPPTFAGMDWEQQSALRSAAETKLRQTEARLQSEADLRLRDATAMHADGKQDPFNLKPEYFDQAYGADGARKFKDYQDGRSMAADISQYMTMPPEQIEAALKNSKAGVDSLAAAGGDGYANADARQQIRMRAAQSVVELQQKDPVAYAAKAGLSNSQPLDLKDMEKFGAEMAGRTVTANLMRDRYKAPHKLLSNAEAAQLSQVMAKFPAAARVDYLTTIRKSVGDPVAYRSVLAQIAPDSPVTAVAGSILGKDQGVTMSGGWFGGDVQMSPKAVATTILQGEAILNPPADAKKQDGRGGKFPMPKDRDMEVEFANYVGKAFRGDSTGYAAAYQAYRAYYAGKASERGILSEDMDGKIGKEALAAVTGGVTDYNGNGEVLKPWGMPEAQFKDSVQSQFNAAMEANGYKGTSLDNIGAYGLLSLRENQYLLTSGNTRLVGRDGQPIVINVASKPDASRQIPGQRPATQVSPREQRGVVQ